MKRFARRRHWFYGDKLCPASLEAIKPGYVNSQMIAAKKPGTYTIRCDGYCGKGHGAMIGTLEVVADVATQEPGAAQPASGKSLDGAKLFASKGCQACHTIGKGVLVGPDLANVGARRDLNYLTRWLENPEQIYRETGKKPINPNITATMPNPGLTADEPL